MKKNRAIFAGSFDPIHQGHLEVIKKAAALFEEVIVIVANNDFKEEQNNPSLRVKEVQSKINIANVKVDYLNDNKYLATYAKENDIKYLVRSARNNMDFDYELDMSKLNKEINDQLETILIIPNYDDIEYSSSKFKNYKIEKK